MKNRDIAVVIPHYQNKEGLLQAALDSVFQQTIADRVHVLVVDDESPSPAELEVTNAKNIPNNKITIIRQKNGGAGSARNTGIENAPPDTRFIAFLDSDDVWRRSHLENAMRALGSGYDAYFSDFYAVGYPDQTNFDRLGGVVEDDKCPINIELGIYSLEVPVLEHIVGDGGGLIQTSTVVYDYERFPRLRFREEFFNGQDFFFWLDLGQLGARFCFSTNVECDNGEGINIYQGSGWGTDGSLRRLRNELKVWTSVAQIYPLSPSLMAANLKTIHGLQESVVRDLMYRFRRKKPVDAAKLKDIIRMDKSLLVRAPYLFLKVVTSKFYR